MTAVATLPPPLPPPPPSAGLRPLRSFGQSGAYQFRPRTVDVRLPRITLHAQLSNILQLHLRRGVCTQAATEGKPWGDRHTELVLIGVDMDKLAVLAALQLACLTDAEMAVGNGNAPEAWQTMNDPFFPAGALDFLVATARSQEGEWDKALQHHKSAMAKRKMVRRGAAFSLSSPAAALRASVWFHFVCLCWASQLALVAQPETAYATSASPSD